LTDVLAQRVFGIAAGYPDGNDADRLAEDPIQKLLLDRHPVQGQALASQPTISRFENAVGPRTQGRDRRGREEGVGEREPMLRGGPVRAVPGHHQQLQVHLQGYDQVQGRELMWRGTVQADIEFHEANLLGRNRIRRRLWCIVVFDHS
jgi:hypothetical protein